MSITSVSRFDESEFHPPSQSMNLNSSLIELGFASHRAGSKALKQLAENEEAFHGSQLLGGGKGAIGGGGESMAVRTFTCDGNPCCFPCDILTLCHLCTGSICCGYRPTLYDRCAPNLFKAKNVEVGEHCCLYCCYDWCYDWFPEKSEREEPIVNSAQVAALPVRPVAVQREVRVERKDSPRREPVVNHDYRTC